MPHQQQPVEMILLRQLASYLAIPMWMMDDTGNLIYYNEAAEDLLGIRFDDVGPITSENLVGAWKVTQLDGSALPEYDFPVVTALSKRKPAHRAIRFQGMDGVWRAVEVTALPIEGQGERFLGVLATFWEVED
ncbi:MAG TPA: PAS domain S-box protein [Acidimicrobiia bacterium]|nr:PAS domain S-box protein [Acidimicrobiia bacterium]